MEAFLRPEFRFHYRTFLSVFRFDVAMTGASRTQLDAFTRGLIVGMSVAGASSSVIAGKVKKPDGEHPSRRSVSRTITKAKRNRFWKGARRSGSGRPSRLPKDLLRKMVRLVFQHRAKSIVTVAFCKKAWKPLRKYSTTVLRRGLHQAGLAWLRRRKKRLVPAPARAERCAYAEWVLRQRNASLKKWAYVDGTTYYLARCESEDVDHARRRLGAYVWRDAAGKDGLFTDNVGPSLYAGTQGRPVKVWGLLANGRICLHVLPTSPGGGSTAHMNGARFRSMIEDNSSEWLQACFGRRLPARVPLVMDFERCLRTQESLECLRRHRLHVVKRHTKHSPDLNAIEGIWARLRQVLHETAPTGRETRPLFIRRLRRAAARLNARHREELVLLCTNQKDRARAVLAKNGATTRW